MNNDQPSVIEVQNAKRILEFLSEMKGISYSTVREDIFAVKSESTGITCIVDVEETLVFMSVEVCNVPESVENQAALNNYMMDLNGKAIHGKFCKLAGKYYYRDYLEFANLDFNELEASLKWSSLMVGANIQRIANLHATGEVGEDIDFDSEELDLDDLMLDGILLAETLVDKEVVVENTEEVIPEVDEADSVDAVTSAAPIYEQSEQPAQPAPEPSPSSDFSEPESSGSFSSDDGGGGGSGGDDHITD